MGKQYRMKMKRVVITGATGEIGIALVQLMIKNGIEVLAICRPASHRLKYLPKSDYVKVIECDLSELRFLQITDKKYDVLYHFAWCASYGLEKENPYIQNDNIKYTLDAVELAARLGCHLFVGAGTQAEYGLQNTPLTPQLPTFPQTMYGTAKLSAGYFSRFLCIQKGISHVWVRIASVYGPCDGPYTLITYIMEQLAHQQDILLTPCEQIWDYLYTEDAAKGFYLIGQKIKENKVYCLGSGNAIPLSIYMKEVQAFAQEKGICAKVKIGAKPYNEKQIMYLCANIDALKLDTGFCPKISFRQGLEKTYQWKEQEKNHGINK